ncbi:hypothetical protein BaRGS_00028776, partial [Batillaria attramentaria]
LAHNDPAQQLQAHVLERRLQQPIYIHSTKLFQNTKQRKPVLARDPSGVYRDKYNIIGFGKADKMAAKMRPCHRDLAAVPSCKVKHGSPR